MTAAPLLARFLHVRRTELDRTLQVAGFAILLGWAMYTAFNATQAIFLAKAGPSAYPLFFIVLAFAVWPMVALQGALTRRLGVGRTFQNLRLFAGLSGTLFHELPALIRLRTQCLAYLAAGARRIQNPNQRAYTQSREEPQKTIVIFV